MKLPCLRLALGGCLLAALASPALATWSILIVDQRTGEIALAQATCIVGPNLQNKLAVVLPGVGAACVQAWWDNAGTRRTLIWQDFQDGLSPAEILAHLNTLSNPQLYQFGIVAGSGEVATFTGTTAGAWAGGITGASGDLAWAIQGNVLAGSGVVLAAEQAIVSTTGRLPERLVAAMHAAAAMGGDGRCSCSASSPDSCGTPPPGFDLGSGKSAHVGFMIVARLGDSLGICDGPHGCANGSYYMNFNLFPGQNGPPDPIVAMEGEYQAWRAGLNGRPDHLESVQRLVPDQLTGDVFSPANLHLQLVDWQGVALTHGGASVRVVHSAQSAGLATIASPIDHGDGSYTIPLVAGRGSGLDQLEVWVDDGQGEILLAPLRQLTHLPTLLVAESELSTSQGGLLHFSLRGPSSIPAQRNYFLLGSLSGTSPGRPFGSLVLPLNPDRFFAFTWTEANGPILHHTRGTLDSNGRAQARVAAPPGFFHSTFLGRELAFAYLLTEPVDFASEPVTVLLLP